MGTHGRVIASDLNHAMLVEGLKKVGGTGLGQKITCLKANAEHLGFRRQHVPCRDHRVLHAQCRRPSRRRSSKFVVF